MHCYLEENSKFLLWILLETFGIVSVQLNKKYIIGLDLLYYICNL